MGNAVFLLHGWLSDINDFACLLPFLEKHYEHIERITYPGHGPGEDYREFSGPMTIELVEKTFEKLSQEYDAIDVIGYSMGGALASYLASKYEVRKLVLLSPANKYFNFRLPFSKIKCLLKILYALQKASIKRDYQNKEVLKQRIKQLFQDDIISLKFARDKYLKSYFRHAFRNFRELIRYVNENTKEIKCPCLIAWGRLDQLIPLASVKYLYDLCTNEQKVLKIYDDLSHLLKLSPNCDELVQDIEKFLVEGGNS